MRASTADSWSYRWDTPIVGAGLASVLVEIGLWITSCASPAGWWPYGVGLWRWDVRVVGLGLVALIAAGAFLRAGWMVRGHPRSYDDGGTLYPPVVAVCVGMAAWLLGMETPHGAVYVLVLAGIPALVAMVQHRGLVGNMVWQAVVVGLVLSAIALALAHNAYHSQQGVWGSWVPTAFTWGMGLPLVGYGMLAMASAHDAATAALRTQAQEPATRRDPEAFSGLVGVDAAVEAIKDAVELPLSYPDRVKRYGVTATKGILLVGPPGTGKTALARAAAAYCGCAFRAVSQGDLVAQHVGSSEAAVRELFAWARQSTPAIIFIDEIDAIGGKRDGRAMNRPSDLVLRCLLAEMDGFEALRGVLVLAATNVADQLDPALRRPGRFDREIEIGLPDAEGRAAIWDVYLKDRPVAGDVDTADLAAHTEGWSPAGIAGAANQAALAALKRNVPISQADLLGAVMGGR